MSPNGNGVVTVLVLALGLSVLCPPTAGAAASESEAGEGPRIVLVAPKDGKVSAPVDIVVRFEPQGAPIDLTTLEVKYVKFFSIDITNRVLPYANAEGINLVGVDLPGGSYEVEISVSDTLQHEASRTLSITVR